MESLLSNAHPLVTPPGSGGEFQLSDHTVALVKVHGLQNNQRHEPRKGTCRECEGC